jgi:hypothetical protein
MPSRKMGGDDAEVLKKLIQSVLDSNSGDSDFSNDELEYDVSISDIDTDSSEENHENVDAHGLSKRVRITTQKKIE